MEEMALQQVGVSGPGRGRLSLKLAVVLGLLGSVGCVTLDNSLAIMGACADKPQCGPVAQIMALWADGLVVQPDPSCGGAPTPGFAGRVYLFGQELGNPLQADGSLTVFLYDLQRPPETQAKPLEAWKVEPEHMPLVFKKDALGWGYNLWLPWRNYNSRMGKVALRVKYEAKDGREIWGSTMPMTIGGPAGPKAPSRLDVVGKK